jgi:hypothetical protein
MPTPNNKTRVRGIESELFLKTRVFLKINLKISQNIHYFMVFFQKNLSF